jgi:GDP-mannose 6-dehydrogenase
MNISVFGLGYVGMVNIACLSKLGHRVYGCDVKPHKVELINQGKSTILEPQIDDLMKAGFDTKMISGHTDAHYCIENTEMALICVGTPSDKNGNVNLNYIVNTAREIGEAIKKLDKKYTLVFRSTIPPGTIEETIMPEIAAVLGSKSGHVNVVFLPEFLREGSAVNDFYNGARIVVGLNANMAGKKEIETAFGFSTSTPFVFTDYKTAEFVKYVDNAYHATKVAFANEVYSIGSKFGVNIKQANDIFLMDSILNISGRYLKPGAPFGGSCLPKDSRAIIHLANTVNVEIPFFRGLLESNKAHQNRMLEKVKGFKGDKILIYGLTFKQNTDDIRESPFLILLKDLLEAGKQVQVVDPNLNKMTLRVEFPEVVKYIHDDLNASVEWADTIVVNKKNMDEIIKLSKGGRNIVNCINNDDYKDKRVFNLF